MATHSNRAFLVAQKVKNLPAMREIWVESLGWEDLLAWRIPWREEPGWLQSMELQRVGHDEPLSQNTSARYKGKKDLNT